jgi:hypothetical protein
MTQNPPKLGRLGPEFLDSSPKYRRVRLLIDEVQFPVQHFEKAILRIHPKLQTEKDYFWGVAPKNKVTLGHA